MSIFSKISKLLSSKTTNDAAISSASDSASVASEKNTGLIRVTDKYGRELQITRQDWLDSVLLGNLESAKSNPDELYSLLISSLNDGFESEALVYAEHLQKIDSDKERGSTVLSIFYMKCERYKDAEKILQAYLGDNGESGVVLTNLAKVYSSIGETDKSEQTLWRALEVDPNQDNGLLWYASIYKELGGDEGELGAFQRAASIEGSWRPQLCLARHALEQGSLLDACTYYRKILEQVEKPVATDILYQMSGDLGLNGHVGPAIELVAPHYVASLHGLEVGNNLIKSYLDTENIDKAQSLLSDLYELNVHAWSETLSYWDTAIAEARLGGKSESIDTTKIEFHSIEGALWLRAGSPFKEYAPAKSEDAPKVVICGGAVMYPDDHESAGATLADTPGRLSRAIPLALSEYLQMHTDARANSIVAWSGVHGFCLFGHVRPDDELISMATNFSEHATTVISVNIDVRDSPIVVNVRIIDVNSAGTRDIALVLDDDSSPTRIESLCEDVVGEVVVQNRVKKLPAPEWYAFPDKRHASNYLLRLEQQLALVMNSTGEDPASGLSGEHEILKGVIQLCVDYKSNAAVRMICTQTISKMFDIRPDVVKVNIPMIQELIKDLPEGGTIGRAANSKLNEIVELLSS